MNKWLVDSGASSHMTREKDLLTDYREFESPEKVGLGDGKAVEAVGVGIARVMMMFKAISTAPCPVCTQAHLQSLFCTSCSCQRERCKLWSLEMLDSRWKWEA